MMSTENINCEETIRYLKQSGHVGFDSLPDILANRLVKKGFTFNILCIGETGIGKSTLLDSLFNTSFGTSVSPHSNKVSLQTNSYELHENSVKLKLTITDTVGYGDQVNKSNTFECISNYIDKQFEDYLQEELKIHKSFSTYEDTRVHICLYLICPTGHGLKAVDLQCMKALNKKVNIIPIISKADTFSKIELEQFKKNVLNEIQNSNVDIYKFPVDDKSIEDVNRYMNDLMPFAVISSTDFIQANNQKIRSRVYPWGIVEVENEFHSDFLKLREMLIRTNTENMREKTHNEHYELYRRKRLRELGFNDDENELKNVSFQKKYEIKISKHNRELEQKEENLKKIFLTRIKDAEQELKKKEKELYESYEQTKREYMEEKEKLDFTQQQLNDEIQEFYRRKAETVTNYHSYYSLTLGKIKKK